MNLFNFSKKRNLNDYLSDTFLFIRIYIGNFIKNYFIFFGSIIGIFFSLLLLVLSKISDNLNLNLNFNIIHSFSFSFIIFNIIFTFLIFNLIHCFLFSYFNICEKKPTRKNFSIKEIFPKVLSLLPRSILFNLLWIPFTVLLYFTVFSFSFLLISKFFFFLFILIPILILGALLTLIFSTQLMIFYIKDQLSFFKSIKNTSRLLLDNFWTKIGSTIIILIISQFISIGGFLIFLFSILANISGLYINKTIIFLINAIGIFSFLITYLLLPYMFLIHQMLIHYSFKKQDKIILEIENIGKHSNENI